MAQTLTIEFIHVQDMWEGGWDVYDRGEANPFALEYGVTSSDQTIDYRVLFAISPHVALALQNEHQIADVEEWMHENGQRIVQQAVDAEELPNDKPGMKSKLFLGSDTYRRYL